MYLVTALTVLSVVSLTSAFHSCPGGEIRKAIKANAFTGDLSKLLDGKSFSDTWRTKRTASMLSCSISKYDFDKGSNTINVRSHNVAKRGKRDIFVHGTWTKNKRLGNFRVSTTVEVDLAAITYEEKAYTFYADENVFGYYACRVGGDHDSWRLAISVLKDKQDDPAVKASVVKAEEVLEKLKPVLSSEFVKLPQTDCPNEV